MSNAVHEGNRVDNLWTCLIAVDPTNTDALLRVIALAATASAATAKPRQAENSATPKPFGVEIHYGLQSIVARSGCLGPPMWRCASKA
jgi:hypothetical protein